ncbi:MAG: sigma factor-like helix-turn-helix DNA-binding protein [Thermodesulfobacteriota bacterium]
MDERRKFPRFPVKKQVVCLRYGKEMIMRTLDISRGGLKLEAPFDLGVGESMNFTILANGTRIHGKGRILTTEDFKNKVHARLRFDHTSDMDLRKMSNCLRIPSRRPLQRRVIGDSLSFLQRIMRRGMMKGVNWGKSIFGGRQGDKKVEQVNLWLELLADMERAVIALRFGLHGEDILSLESIGKRFGLTPERIRQIEKEAIEKLRKISKKKEIYLDDII